MKQFIILIALAFSITSCVQKAYNKKVTFILNTAGIKNIQSVGIRGEEKPLSWKNDLELTPIIKDSLYKVSVTFLTGYTFTEVKFTINGEFELNDQPNRRIIHGINSDTTIQCVFNKI